MQLNQTEKVMIDKFSMRTQMHQIPLAFIFLLFLITGCENEESSFEIGEDLVESKTEISMVDSFTVKLSTVIYDSIPTSGSGLALIGKYENDYTGSVQSNTYFNFDLNSELYAIDEETIFDSITISLQYADYRVGDSTEFQNIEVYRLTDQLELQEDDFSDTYLFNTSSFSHEENPLGTKSFYPHPYKETFEIRLDDVLGLELLQMVNDDADEFSSNLKFNEYLKGFVIKPSSTSGNAVNGFYADSILLNLHTHVVKLESEEKIYQFRLTNNNTQYNQVISDRSGTYFENLLTQREELNSTDSEDMSYLQGGSGTVIRIDFPTLNDLFKLEDMVMLKAELVLHPLINYTDVGLPKSLYFYNTDRINQFGDQVSYEIDSETQYVSATLYEDKLYNENTQYSADITSFISTQLAGNFYDTDNGLLLSLLQTNLLSTVDHVILYGENASNYKPSLNLYFLTYE